MKGSQTISWIFLAIAISSKKQPVKFSEISTIADGINHAVPTQVELQASIKWLMEKELILKLGKKYELSDTGKNIFSPIESNSHTLMQMWDGLEQVLANGI